MTRLREGGLVFSFDDASVAVKYDESDFYQRKFRTVVRGLCAVDMVCAKEDGLWLLEVKDYRRQAREDKTTQEIAEAVAKKVTDTMAGLFCSHLTEPGTSSLSQIAGRAGSIQVVMHVELPEKVAGDVAYAQLFNLSVLLQKRLQKIGIRSFVANRDHPEQGVPWHVDFAADEKM